MNSSKYLTPEETNALLHVLGHGLKALDRDSVMLYVALRCGLRASELLGLTQACLDHQRRTMSIQTIKRGVPREVPAPRELFEYARTVATPRVFAISYPRLVQVWHMYRPCQKKFHSLRHTFALGLYSRRKDINLVKHVLGHKSLSSTTVYLDAGYALNELKTAMRIK